MAQTTITNCCNSCDEVNFVIDKVCPCFSGFSIAGLTINTSYIVAIESAKDVYVRDFTSDGSGVLLIDMSAFPDSIVNRFGGQYVVEIDGVTFETEGYTGFTFFVSDCTDSGYVTINETPNV